MSAPAPEDTAPTEAVRPARPCSPVLAAALVALLVVPLIVAAVALHSPRWYPTLDLAMTELRVRDVGTSDTPLIGLPGRIGTLEKQGSHPGPLSFYGLAPTYRALGSSAWSLQVGALVLVAAAMGTCVLLARRRGGPRLVAGVAAVVAALAAGYGFTVLSEPWNPYMPLFWWLAFVLACWGIAVGDRWLLPVAVALGSFCAQTHLPYVGLTVGLGLGSVGLALLADRSPPGRRALVRPALAAVAVGLVLWSPAVADQLFRDPGNVGMIADHFADPPEDPVGLASGARVILVHLDLSSMAGLAAGGSGSLVDASYDPEGTIVPGLALLAVWGVAVLVAWRARVRRLLGLHLVLAGGLVLGVVSASNIFGKIWYYLTLWAWGLSALVVFSIVATTAAVIEPRWTDERRATWYRASLGGLIAAVAFGCVVLSGQALDADEPAPLLSRGLGLVVDPTEAALREGVGSATGSDGRYAVTWSDALFIGSQGYGLVSELERAGLDVGVRSWAAAPVTPHRVIPPDQVTAVVHFASGAYIEQWAAKPGVELVIEVDPRTPAERSEYEALEADLIADLEDSGFDDLLPSLEGNVFGASLDPRLSDAQRDDFGRLLDLGLPVAVFIAPPDVDPF